MDRRRDYKVIETEFQHRVRGDIFAHLLYDESSNLWAVQINHPCGSGPFIEPVVLECTSEEVARRMYQDLKWSVIYIGSLGAIHTRGKDV